MKIKNVAKGGRGIGVASADPKEPGILIEWAPGEVKEVDDATIARAKKDPANAATLTEEGGLVEVSAEKRRVSVTDAEAKADTKGSAK